MEEDGHLMQRQSDISAVIKSTILSNSAPGAVSFEYFISTIDYLMLLRLQRKLCKLRY
jgi:hypothetical protein